MLWAAGEGLGVEESGELEESGVCCAPADKHNADASISAANWLGNGLRDLGKSAILFILVAAPPAICEEGNGSCPLATLYCKARAKL